MAATLARSGARPAWRPECGVALRVLDARIGRRYAIPARNSSSVSLNQSGRSRLGMWATSGRSIRRAPGIPAATSSAERPCRRRVEAADDHERRHADLAQASDGRRVEHDRVPVRLLLHVRLVGHPANGLARRGGRAALGLPDAVDPQRHVDRRHRRPVLGVSKLPPRAPGGKLLGRVLALVAAHPAADPDQPGHAIRVFERGVDHDRARPRAADEHGAVEAGGVHDGDPGPRGWRSVVSTTSARPNPRRS